MMSAVCPNMSVVKSATSALNGHVGPTCRSDRRCLALNHPRKGSCGTVSTFLGGQQLSDRLKRNREGSPIGRASPLPKVAANLTGYPRPTRPAKPPPEQSADPVGLPTRLSKPAPVTTLELSALTSDSSGAEQLAAALNDQNVGASRRGNHVDLEALVGPDLRAQAAHMLENLGNGTISVSAYDTAWLARLAEPESTRPLFPKALQWLLTNQLPDGSWGDPVIVMYHDRILCTLSALVALKTWEADPGAAARGERFVRARLARLALEAREVATCGFELLFPSLMETAKGLGLDLPYDHPYAKSVEAVRAQKLANLPLEVRAQSTSDSGVSPLDAAAEAVRVPHRTVGYCRF